ncbi:MAG: ankyrin repeat domain-containing protein [Acidiferrobacterales bacterium]|nr:ankyrin repeat domain-containing protein [Acidiferrobacterales bacterium]
MELSEEKQIEVSSLVRNKNWLNIAKLIDDKEIEIESSILDDSTVYGRVFKVYAEFCYYGESDFIDEIHREIVNDYFAQIEVYDFSLPNRQSYLGALLYTDLDRKLIEEFYKSKASSFNIDKTNVYKSILSGLFSSEVKFDQKEWALNLVHKYYSDALDPSILGKALPDRFVSGQQRCLWKWNRDLNNGLAEDFGMCSKKFTLDTNLLLSHNADINAKSDEGGHTGAMRAAMTWMPEALEFLISKGADVNLVSKMGNSALMYVSGYLPDASPMNEAWEELPEHLQIAKILVEAGIDISIKNDQGETAASLARKNKNSAVLEFLESL